MSKMSKSFTDKKNASSRQLGIITDKKNASSRAPNRPGKC